MVICSSFHHKYEVPFLEYTCWRLYEAMSLHRVPWLDLTGNDDGVEGHTEYIDLKDNGWVGVSLDAQPHEDGRVMVSVILSSSELSLSNQYMLYI